MAQLMPHLDEDGFQFTALIAEDRTGFEGEGLILGPPEKLKELVLPAKQLKDLFIGLNELYLFKAQDIQGRRPDLVTLLINIGVPRGEVNGLIRHILSIYQAEFFGES